MDLIILGAAGETMATAFGTSLVLLVSFLVLLGALSYFVWNPVKKIMDDREKVIHDDIQNAENSKKDAARLRDENEALLKQTQSEISEMFENSRKQANAEQELIIKEANARASHLITEAKADIEREKERAMREINDQVADLSVLIAEKVIQKELTATDQQELVKKYLQEAGDR
ncbi:F0F1 ATP synthase subunit B [Phocicoccus pinnipedialis]|uniref:ATP synthase subunit b n=1 Tax=Phocicoccus pinnipedialis TaxID=110845 RepID=A0A6V7R455_9BACL|nr:F0F1 ATP synthase subunit B [Jeotgalicoccus pinnipedialis]MBP1939936.1 F-type H+-transporting ATPase subunit b [Jeotgalicoccus pinnipedialis]CAD2072116.1 ATP synthase subunit b [Jeotgalicoccus pinnipedialis]